MCEYLRPVVAQGLLLLYKHDHVDGNFTIGRNTEHDYSQETTSYAHLFLSKKLPVMHGYVEDMKLSDTTQVTGDH